MIPGVPVLPWAPQNFRPGKKHRTRPWFPLKFFNGGKSKSPLWVFWPKKSHCSWTNFFDPSKCMYPLLGGPKSHNWVQTNFKKVISIPGWWKFWPTPPFFDFFRLFSGFLISLHLIVHFFKFLQSVFNGQIEGFSGFLGNLLWF